MVLFSVVSSLLCPKGSHLSDEHFCFEASLVFFFFFCCTFVLDIVSFLFLSYFSCRVGGRQAGEGQPNSEPKVSLISILLSRPGSENCSPAEHWHRRQERTKSQLDFGSQVISFEPLEAKSWFLLQQLWRPVQLWYPLLPNP